MVSRVGGPHPVVLFCLSSPLMYWDDSHTHYPSGKPSHTSAYPRWLAARHSLNYELIFPVCPVAKSSLGLDPRGRDPSLTYCWPWAMGVGRGPPCGKSVRRE